jgi:transcriptional regulator with XRE-family HTH domain
MTNNIEMTSEERIEIGQELKQKREALGKSIHAVAFEVGCGTPNLEKFENGEHVDGWNLIWKGYENTLELTGARRELAQYEDSITFDNPNSWSNDEKVEFAEILLHWITVEDHTADLYDFLRDINTEASEHGLLTPDKFTRKFEELFHKELDSLDMLEFYERHYQKRINEYNAYKAIDEMKNNIKKTLTPIEVTVLNEVLEIKDIQLAIYDNLTSKSEDDVASYKVLELVKEKFPKAYAYFTKKVELLEQELGSQEVH